MGLHKIPLKDVAIKDVIIMANSPICIAKLEFLAKQNAEYKVRIEEITIQVNRGGRNKAVWTELVPHLKEIRDYVEIRYPGHHVIEVYLSRDAEPHVKYKVLDTPAGATFENLVEALLRADKAYQFSLLYGKRNWLSRILHDWQLFCEGRE